MVARTRLIEVAARRAERRRRELADELRERRLGLDLSQAEVAAACGMSRNHYVQLEGGRLSAVNLQELDCIALALGLDVALRLYPGGRPIRDAGHSARLLRLLRQARPPLGYRIEAPLPAKEDRFERRAWDAMLFGDGQRTAIELEMRMRDVQAMRRRHALKRRDDPTEHFLLVIADTRHNRRVLAEFGELFDDLPRLRPSVVRALLEAGRHPSTGLLLV
jgi:transcriptional regulator with XRE-family HTH domain